MMQRLVIRALGITAVAIGVVAVAGGFASAGAQAINNLPTLTLAFNGSTVTVGGSTVSGAVNVQTTVTGAKSGNPALFRLNPGVPYSAFATAVQTVGQHHGDLNYLEPYGSLIFNTRVGSGVSTEQTLLAPGNYFALNAMGNGAPAHAAFTVTQSANPAALPTPGATVSTIEFGFIGPKTLKQGEIVRFQNNGFLVHMDVYGRVKNVATGNKVDALLLAGKKPGKLVSSMGTFAGPMSTGGIVQEQITAKPGVYVQACFMNTQDGRSHTRLGQERVFKIIK